MLCITPEDKSHFSLFFLDLCNMVALELLVVLKWLRIFFEIIKAGFVYFYEKEKSVKSLTVVPDYHGSLRAPISHTIISMGYIACKEK